MDEFSIEDFLRKGSVDVQNKLEIVKTVEILCYLTKDVI